MSHLKIWWSPAIGLCGPVQLGRTRPDVAGRSRYRIQRVSCLIVSIVLL